MDAEPTESAAIPFANGPFIQAACFCESVIEDKSGTISLIRVIDTVTRSARGPNPPEVMPSFVQMMNLVVMLKSGMALGRSEVKIIPHLPDGATEDSMYFTVHFEGAEKGVNLVVGLGFEFKLEGVYWFKVYIDDVKVTELPIRIKYDRVFIQGPKPG